MFFNYVKICDGISSDNRDKITEILARNNLEFKIKSKIPSVMNSSFDGARMGSVGSKNDEIRYSVLVRKEDADLALNLMRTA